MVVVTVENKTINFSNQGCLIFKYNFSRDPWKEIDYSHVKIYFEKNR